MVEDADSEILLDEGESPADNYEFNEFHGLVTYSGETFYTRYRNPELADWLTRTGSERPSMARRPSAY